MCVCGTHAPQWRSEDNLQESVLSFYHAGSQTSTQDLRLSVTCFYPQNNLVDLQFSFIDIHPHMCPSMLCACRASTREEPEEGVRPPGAGFTGGL